MRFEWDENKRWLNLRKHDIDFADIISAFDSDMYVSLDDGSTMAKYAICRLGYSSARWWLSYTESDEVIRIISARKAEVYEQEIYFKNVRD